MRTYSRSLTSRTRSATSRVSRLGLESELDRVLHERLEESGGTDAVSAASSMSRVKVSVNRRDAPARRR